MGAYAYCGSCNAPLEAPKVEEFLYDEPRCYSCNSPRGLDGERAFREVLIAEHVEQGQKIATLEAALLELSKLFKDDGK